MNLNSRVPGLHYLGKNITKQLSITKRKTGLNNYFEERNMCMICDILQHNCHSVVYTVTPRDSDIKQENCRFLKYSVFI